MEVIITVSLLTSTKDVPLSSGTFEKGKTMKTRRTAILLLCCILMSTISLTVSAALPDPITPMWDNVLSLNATLTFNGTTGNVSAFINGKSGVTNIDATVTLYYKNTNGVWVEQEKNWDYNTNQSLLGISETFTGARGVEYKIVVDATVTKGNVEETVSKTATATCPGH